MSNGKSDQVLARIDRAKQYLAEARNLMDVNRVIALAAAATVYAKQVQASVETINRAAEIRLRAERRLGELLREPGQKAKGGGNGSNQHKKATGTRSSPVASTLADAGISKKLSSRAQTLAAVPAEQFEEALNVPPGEDLNPNRVVMDLQDRRRRDKRRAARAQASKDAPQDDDRIIIGDFRKLAGRVANGSVSLIFTDPPYCTRRNEDAPKLLDDLGSFAASKLVDGGSLLLYVGTTQLPLVLDVLRSHLRYWWTIACIHSGRGSILRNYGINARWKVVLWFVKGTRDDNSVMVSDVMTSGEEKALHDWQQGESEAAYWIEKLCPQDGLVCDPFLGSGTTAAAAESLGKGWVGFEIDDGIAAIARKRVSQPHRHSSVPKTTSPT